MENCCVHTAPSVIALLADQHLLLWPVAVTSTDGAAGSFVEMVSVVVWWPLFSGLKLTSNGKQKSGLICTGKPEFGEVTLNCAFDEVIDSTSKFSFPVLHTWRSSSKGPRPQTSPKSRSPGMLTSGTAPTRKASNRMPSAPGFAGGTPGGDVPDGQAANRRPATQALPL
jgi:hypothetical protein